jgi:hypothetical protein
VDCSSPDCQLRFVPLRPVPDLEIQSGVQQSSSNSSRTGHSSWYRWPTSIKSHMSYAMCVSVVTSCHELGRWGRCQGRTPGNDMICISIGALYRVSHIDRNISALPMNEIILAILLGKSFDMVERRRRCWRHRPGTGESSGGGWCTASLFIPHTDIPPSTPEILLKAHRRQFPGPPANWSIRGKSLWASAGEVSEQKGTFWSVLGLPPMCIAGQ